MQLERGNRWISFTGVGTVDAGGEEEFAGNLLATVPRRAEKAADEPLGTGQHGIRRDASCKQAACGPVGILLADRAC
jgi:hypothetical protein